MIKKKLTSEEMEQQLLENEKLVYYTINRFFPDLINDEDTFQIGLIALWKALKSYKYGNQSISAYAVMCVKRAILDEIRKENSQSRKAIGGNLVQLNAKKGKNEDLEVEDSIEDITVADPSIIVGIKDFVDNLNDEDRTIVILKHRGYTNQEVSIRLGISDDTVRRRLNNIKSKMKQECF